MVKRISRLLDSTASNLSYRSGRVISSTQAHDFVLRLNYHGPISHDDEFIVGTIDDKSLSELLETVEIRCYRTNFVLRFCRTFSMIHATLAAQTSITISPITRTASTMVLCCPMYIFFIEAREAFINTLSMLEKRGGVRKSLEDIRDWGKDEKVEDSRRKGDIDWVTVLNRELLMEFGGLTDERQQRYISFDIYSTSSRLNTPTQASLPR
ncbi:hypothetical protein BC830DRAFT_1100692 [Chytriomyces sp. MP71]|nr:hypothetical protein BC830DRAFT_1100692 [Chytriomyces sp. MP71]